MIALRARCAAWALALCLGAVPAAHAGFSRYCDPEAVLTAGQQDKVFRFGAIIRAELEGSGSTAALIARSGLDLDRFGVRYSHAGVSLKDSGDTPWAVRQLYFACEERKPLLYDQGLAAFLLGSREPDVGYVSVLLLPPAPAQALARTALDKRRALQLLHSTYSANAYAFSVQYQNCNQWLAELLAVAWGGLADADGGAAQRAQAQRWLQQQGFVPTVFNAGWMLGLSSFTPFIHTDDHPAEDLAQRQFRVSMPAALEAFVRQAVPGARRVEFCHTTRHVVVHQGWDLIGEGCVPGPGDKVIALD